MKLEAVIVCINYADFLSVTLPTNKSLFDKIVVVTDTKDTETAKVCELWNVQCVKTDDFYENDSRKPNKAKGINKGLSYLQKDGWVVQLDADIWLPSTFRTMLENCSLQDDCLYGIDRMMCNSYKDWFNYMYFNKKPIHEGWVYLHTNIFPIGQRIVKYHDKKNKGYIPIGFFQLWNPKVSNVYNYPTKIAGYDRTDVLFSQQFNQDQRRFIPDVLCIHLASEKAKQGQNWQGRISKPFVPNFFQKWYIKIYNWIKNLFKRILEYFRRLLVEDIDSYFQINKR